ncbi:hypothetical protein [Flaviaesturariibacter amylovorans]|uniref:Uncharacterized protein n=1 Tax=Flaviaesturariibacter amylovorans TaxID=1084520 RepID=A0ABP8GDY2_9BACT
MTPPSFTVPAAASGPGAAAGARPDIVLIEMLGADVRSAYALADAFRAQGCHVCLAGHPVAALPLEAGAHADTIFLGPGAGMFPLFLNDFRGGLPRRVYAGAPPGYGSAPAADCAATPPQPPTTRFFYL